MLQTSRDILSNAFGVLLGLLAGFTPSVLILHIPWYAKTLSLLVGWAVIGILMWQAVKGMKTAEQRIDKAEKDRHQELVTTMQKHTEAIVAALQKNSETTISAMREPLDGHE
jgi:protein-S-isoprenylcysteine O-methyltransferase Ste14